MNVQGFRLLTYCALLLGLLAIFVLPAETAQAMNKTGCGINGDEPCETGFESSDPAIKKAMMTLPDAMAQWKTCYAGCLKGKGCSALACSSDCEGKVVAMGYAASKTSEMLRYNIMGIYGANCIGDFRKYIQTIQDAAKRTHDLGLGVANVLAGVIVDKILDAVIGQILNNLTNQICSVTNQLTAFADGVVNSVCMPNVTINPFNFNLNLKNLSCDDGFAINPLTGQVNGSPINGVSLPITNIYNDNGGAVQSPTIIDTVPVPTYTPPSTVDDNGMPISPGVL